MQWSKIQQISERRGGGGVLHQHSIETNYARWARWLVVINSSVSTQQTVAVRNNQQSLETNSIILTVLSLATSNSDGLSYVTVAVLSLETNNSNCDMADVSVAGC